MMTRQRMMTLATMMIANKRVLFLARIPISPRSALVKPSKFSGKNMRKNRKLTFSCKMSYATLKTSSIMQSSPLRII